MHSRVPAHEQRLATWTHPEVRLTGFGKTTTALLQCSLYATLRNNNLHGRSVRRKEQLRGEWASASV